MSGRLTTHVLDTALGKPAAGVKVQLWRQAGADAAGELLAEAATNADGRLDAPLLAGDAMAAGTYELVFFVRDYFLRTQTSPAMFLDAVPIRFTIASPGEHYHVPLLIAPGGYSTYRGS
ncbi:hydroxyisourate hydrolase [Paenibacillus sp.]|uniref:hydroxyisourate hydrolase n=1 Tax=Paenibacillus sp. TaxID=58172 RepID=UPI002D34701D|nr:hydroxyisourate hydrolase [Paenibacillus sp.]HZG83984.1 hydroxyisourate hydrolase [Paenibacillus sp.]